MLFNYNKFIIEKEDSLYRRFILLNEPKDKDLLSQKEVKFEFNPKFCIITEKEEPLLNESLELQTYNNFILTISQNENIKNIDFDYCIICNICKFCK